MRKYRIVEIEDMTERFSGIRRRHIVSLEDAEPEIAAEWLYEKNAGWGPGDVTRASAVKAWWKCPDCDREYKAQICNRTSVKSACPYCASKKVAPENALTNLYPEIAAEWHHTRNKKLKVEDVIKKSARRVFWLCSKCHHSWAAKVSDRTKNGSGCPACYEARMEEARKNPKRAERVRRVLDADTTQAPVYIPRGNEPFVSLYSFSKKVAKQWHPTKNGTVTPKDVSKGSDTKVWWKCPEGPDHEWQTPVYTRTSRFSGCPCCLNLKVSGTNSLKVIAPEVAEEWHPTKNGNLTPDQVLAGSSKVAWWQCKADKSHVWETPVTRRVGSGRVKGTKCPHCRDTISLAYPDVAAELHPTKNGKLNGDNIRPSSIEQIWWKCPHGRDHVWQATPLNRTYLHTGCPACVGRQLSVTNCLKAVDLQTAKIWHPTKNGKLTPAMVLPGSKEIVWWLCPKGHQWKQSILNRVGSPYKCGDCCNRKAGR